MEARKGGTTESENVVRECKAVAEEELRSGWNQFKKQDHKIDHGNRSKPSRGIKRKSWEIGQDFRNIEAILGRCSDDINDEGHRVELEFEAIKRVMLGEERRWTILMEGSQRFSVEKEEQTRR